MLRVNARTTIGVWLLLFVFLTPSATLGFSTQAKQAFLYDFQTGHVLLEKNADTPMPPASMSKIMSAYLVFEEIKSGRLSMDDEILISENAWRKGGSKMFVKVNDRVKVRDILRGIIVQSGNDAAIAIAEHLEGSEAAFAEKMTSKARRLGLRNAKFKNATGWPDPEHRITARELAKLAKLTIQNFPNLYSIYAETNFTYNGIKQGNRNPLLYSGFGADGLKTGRTRAAGYGLTASVQRAGRRLILVINGLKSSRRRKNEAKQLIEWGFREFENYKFYEAGESVTSIDVWLGTHQKVEAAVEDDILLTLRRSDKDKIKISLAFEEPIAAPIKKGQTIGLLKIKSPDEAAKEYPLLASKDVERLGPFRRILAAINYLIWGASD